MKNYKYVHDLELDSDFQLIFRDDKLKALLKEHCPVIYYTNTESDKLTGRTILFRIKFGYAKYDVNDHLEMLYLSTEKYDPEARIYEAYPENNFSTRPKMEYGGTILNLEDNLLDRFEIDVASLAETPFERNVSKTVKNSLKRGLKNNFDFAWKHTFTTYLSNIKDNYLIKSKSGFFKSLLDWINEYSTELKIKTL